MHGTTKRLQNKQEVAKKAGPPPRALFTTQTFHASKCIEFDAKRRGGPYFNAPRCHALFCRQSDSDSLGLPKSQLREDYCISLFPKALKPSCSSLNGALTRRRRAKLEGLPRLACCQARPAHSWSYVAARRRSSDAQTDNRVPA